MESQENQIYFSTNWSIGDGDSLSNVIFVESSVSSINDTSISSSAKLPFCLLRPQSPEPSPCEIKVCFTKKHEVLQVYVRSSARVYEIYYAADPQSSNDYLCTVHCCNVANYGDTANNIDEEAPHNLTMLCKREAEESGKEDISNNEEDDWVDVRPLDSSSMTKPRRNNSQQNKNATNIGTATLVLYEATAEISDANPCMSLTLRLLSHENKQTVYVDEIYIFADPSETNDLEIKTEKSSQSSLAALLVPALIQLSKTSRAQGKHVSASTQKQYFEESGSYSRESAKASDEIQKMEDRPISVGSQTPPEVSENKGKHSCTYGKENLMQSGHPKTSLEQLVFGLARVENICLRLENSLDARLRKVEEQLEVVNGKFQSKSSTPISTVNRKTKLPSSRSFSPEFNTLDEKDESTTSRRPCPGLVVAAPEFLDTDDDDEKGNVTSAPEFVGSYDNNENDAIAPGFGGTVPPLYDTAGFFVAPIKAPTLRVKAPDFSVEEDDEKENDSTAPECIHTDNEKGNDSAAPKIDGTDFEKENEATALELGGTEQEKKKDTAAPEFVGSNYENENDTTAPGSGGTEIDTLFDALAPTWTVKTPEFSVGEDKNSEIIVEEAKSSKFSYSEMLNVGDVIISSGREPLPDIFSSGDSDYV